LNSSKTSYGAFTLDRKSFFQDYTFTGTPSAHLSFQVFNKAFYSIFKTRGADARDQDTGIERCEIRLVEEDYEPECRLVARLTCMHGTLRSSND
jgi:Rad9